jgi:hypothetical protein
MTGHIDRDRPLQNPLIRKPGFGLKRCEIFGAFIPSPWLSVEVAKFQTNFLREDILKSW